ncbi:MAG TPA: hypothetical protein VFM05_07670 [Candidatus Saccharimonadales bacterium]|nr:hypothetical protein [Candidatus Saccharimonadales bacterium]
MLKGIDSLRTNNAVNIHQRNATRFKLVLERTIKIRTASRKTVNRLDDKELYIVLGVFAIVDSLLHRLQLFGGRLKKDKELSNGNATRGRKAFDLLLLRFRRVTVKALLGGRNAYGGNSVLAMHHQPFLAA